MKDQLTTFRTAKLAKEMGFKTPTRNGWRFRDEQEFEEAISYGEANAWDLWEEEMWLSDWYIRNLEDPSKRGVLIPQPTQSLLQRWLREKHDIHISISFTFGSENTFITYVNRDMIKDKAMKELADVGLSDHKLFNGYEEALEAGLAKALELIKYK